MTRTSMMKKRGRERAYCDNRHCWYPSDAHMHWYDPGSQRARERREWQREQESER